MMAWGHHDTADSITKGLTIDVKVYAPFEVYFEGKAYSISAVNDKGPFDILPKHHKFLCMLTPCDVVVHTEDESKAIQVERALMHVKEDRVVVFVGV